MSDLEAMEHQTYIDSLHVTQSEKSWKKESRIALGEVIAHMKAAFLDVVNLELSSVTAVTQTDEGWTVVVEVVERKAIPDTLDLLGVYEVRLNHDGILTGYERTRMRRRVDLDEQSESR